MIWAYPYFRKPPYGSFTNKFWLRHMVHTPTMILMGIECDMNNQLDMVVCLKIGASLEDESHELLQYEAILILTLQCQPWINP